MTCPFRNFSHEYGNCVREKCPLWDAVFHYCSFRLMAKMLDSIAFDVMEIKTAVKDILKRI